MLEVPTIIKTWVDSDGVTVYTVLYKDGSTCDMIDVGSPYYY
nr:MAG TPA: hypothetical protein [Inoviridae sp.]